MEKKEQRPVLILRQSRKQALMESIINVCSGMVIAFCMFQFVLAPLLGIPVTMADNAIITSVLTVVSILRGFLWRRLFDYIHYKQSLRRLR